MKLLVLTQAKIEGGDNNPKAVGLGKFAVNVEEIQSLYEAIDKYDVPIKNFVIIRTRCNESYQIFDTFESLVTKIEEFTICQ